MLEAMDNSFAFFKPEHRIANKQAQIPTESNK